MPSSLCYGSRFTLSGEGIEGLALAPLKRKALPAEGKES
jgi:hypothetical protein